MPIRNMDFISGATAVVLGLTLAVAARLLDGDVGELAALSLSLLIFGGGAFFRWLRRPTDGDPDSTLPVSEVLEQLGLPSFEGESREQLERRARAGWVPVSESEPGPGELVIAVVGDEVVVARWGSPKVEGATHWRRHPPLPR